MMEVTTLVLQIVLALAPTIAAWLARSEAKKAKTQSQETNALIKNGPPK